MYRQSIANNVYPIQLDFLKSSNRANVTKAKSISALIRAVTFKDLKKES
jgi:hypothetical protein